ncbi:MAG: hypothetical protein Q8Q95_00360 [bacterium]|nr:hypothetical protein [bacterium]
MNLKITYSIEKDTKNHLDGVFEFKHLKHGRENIREKLLSQLDSKLRKEIENSKNKEDAGVRIKTFLNEWEIKNHQKIENVIKNLENKWEEKGGLVLQKLENLYKKEFPFDNITIYLTSLSLCPYSYKDKFIYIYLNDTPEKQIKVLLHELNHFMFYFYYLNLKDKLGYEKYELLKESLSYFSNPEQKGKPNEKGLRNLYASKQWGSIDEVIKEGKDFLLNDK